MRTGDTVIHRLMAEDWIVASVSPDGKEFTACGWPETVAFVADATVTSACSDEEHETLLRHIAEGEGIRASWARHNLDALEARR